LVSVKHNYIYLIYFTMTSRFGPLTIIKPSLQNLKRGATQCK